VRGRVEANLIALFHKQLVGSIKSNDCIFNTTEITPNNFNNSYPVIFSRILDSIKYGLQFAEGFGEQGSDNVIT
tara:strand:- start:283 stop:504 length:222 start_codon:yes stop_codon:yes gene_type:complete